MRWSNRYNIVAASYIFPGIDKVLSCKATQGFSVCSDVKHVHVSLLYMYMFHITPYRVKVSSFPTLINNSTDIRKEQFTGVSRTGRYV